MPISSIKKKINVHRNNYNSRDVRFLNKFVTFVKDRKNLWCKDFMPDALPGATLPVSRLGTGSTNGSNNGRGWGTLDRWQYLFWSS
jgi:hypothetical protein